MTETLRDRLIAQAENQFHLRSEHPFPTLPESQVLRHPENQKWFALFMRVTRAQLGLTGKEPVDILNVCCPPLLAGSLRLQPGFLPGYHMNHERWLTVLLDGTVEESTALHLIDVSYGLVGPGVGSGAWLLPADPRRFDIDAAFANNDGVLMWHQQTRVKAGDWVYLYVTAPCSAILYQCRAEAVNAPTRTGQPEMALRLVHRLREDQFSLSRMKTFQVGAVRGARRVPRELAEALNAECGTSPE